MAYDILIKDGTIIDGTGMPAYRGDVGVKDGIIVERGRLDGAADQVIDAEGLVVAPGLIDIHTHYDPHLIWDPKVTSSCWHGVTSVVMGNCGLSLAPLKPEHREPMMAVFGKVEELAMDSLRSFLPWDWESYGEYLDRVDQGLGVNVAGLVGHNAIRLTAMGEAAFDRAANTGEIEAMKGLLRESLAAGALGWSTSQAPTHVGPKGEPVPSRLAEEQELLELAGVMAEAGRGYTEMNSRSVLWGLGEEDRALMEKMALAGRRPLVWLSHSYKWERPDTWRVEQEWMREASERGASLYGVVRLSPVDRPVHLRRTTLFDGLATWRDIMELEPDERKAKLADPELRAALRHAMDHPETKTDRGQIRPKIRWQALRVEEARLPKNRELEGLLVTEAAAKRGVHVADFIADMAVEEDLDTVYRLKNVVPEDEGPRGELLKSPFAMLGNSDSGAHINMDCNSGEPTWFLRHWVLDRGLMSLEEGIRRWTWVPASVMGLTDRGLVREGMRADLIVFSRDQIRAKEPEMVQDVPGGETRWIQKADGIHHTIVNGRVTLNGDQHTGELPGRVLRSSNG